MLFPANIALRNILPLLLLLARAEWSFNAYLLPACSDFGRLQSSDPHLLHAVFVLESLLLVLKTLPYCHVVTT